MKITLLGAGAWGTALAIAFAGKHAVTLWSRETDVAEDLRLNRENHRFFPGYRLPDAVVVSTDFAAAVVDAELLVVATPRSSARRALASTRKRLTSFSSLSRSACSVMARSAMLSLLPIPRCPTRHIRHFNFTISRYHPVLL